ncbi:ras-like protein [Anaeramoeba flamelloides]|uniref:Ras-like protein n=1 Tax=Anaeramoeba flamelloides TaxID=1746091 RepID=A0ABQ8Z7Y6_9EUKA|nr:ras-like protein [Anaeramoeba flamelloides]
MSNQNKFVIVLMGDGSVGKSCLTIQYIQNRFINEYDPTVAESYNKMVIVDNIPSTLQIMDTAGQREYHYMEDDYFTKGEGFMFVFSLTSSSSLKRIKDMHTRLLQVRSAPVCVLVGNKSDLNSERQISRKEAEAIAKKKKLPYFETSANTREGVAKSFETIIRLIRNFKKKGGLKNDLKTKKVDDITDHKSGCCTII